MVVFIFWRDARMLLGGPLAQRVTALPVWRQAAVYALLLLALTVLGVYGVHYVEKPFIYFQF